MQNARQQIERALALVRQGRIAQAEVFARQVLAADRRNADAMVVLGLAASKRGRPDEAANWHRQSIALQRREPAYYCNLGHVYAAVGRFDKALSCFEKALKLQGDLEIALAGKAGVLERQGRFVRALALLGPAVNAPSASLRLASVYARVLQRMGRDEEAVHFGRERLDRVAADESSEDPHRRALWFVVGRSCETLRRFDDAFEAFTRANEIAARPYDADRVEREHARMREVFAREARSSLATATHDASRAVLIAGMPRSGGTLLERILAAHPACHGAGELPDLSLLLEAIPELAHSEAAFPDNLCDLDVEALNELGGRYLDRLAALGGGARRVVDKSLDLPRLLGFAAHALPGAKVLHLRRHPLDVCLSCFAHDLPPDQHPYASNLNDLGRHFALHTRLMEFWKAALDLDLLDVQYEALVTDPEPVIREILAFLDLDWNEACLQHHRSSRNVATLSYDQVQQPIYQSAVGRHAPYERHLGPLREVLGGLIDERRG